MKNLVWTQPDPREPFKYLFDCPGCGNYHGFNEEIWKFNGDLQNPTVTPSILVRWTEMTEAGRKKYQECMQAGHPIDWPDFPTEDKVCHLFIKEGRIQFLNDCTHELKGQTVDMIPVNKKSENQIWSRKTVDFDSDEKGEE